MATRGRLLIAATKFNAFLICSVFMVQLPAERGAALPGQIKQNANPLTRRGALRVQYTVRP